MRSICCKSEVQLDETYEFSAGGVDGGKIDMYSCSKCGNACATEDLDPAPELPESTKENLKKLTETPLLRAYHHPSRSFLPLGFLGLDNNFYVDTGTGFYRVDDVSIDLFTGLFTKETGAPVYQKDRVVVAISTPWNSLYIAEGVVHYDNPSMCFYIEADDGREIQLGKILRITGHDYG